MRMFPLVAAVVFGADRLTKVLALDALDMQSTLPVWQNVFHLTLVHNTGVAFGMFKNGTSFFAAAALISAAAILFYLFRAPAPQSGWERARLWAWAAIAGGALGNAYDRIRLGAVVDFLDFRVWPVFNLADSAIVCGALIVAASAFFKKDA